MRKKCKTPAHISHKMLHRQVVKPTAAAGDIFPTVVQHPHSFLGGLFVKVSSSHSETHCRTPLNDWCVSRRDLYLTTHNTHKRQTAMHPVGFKPAIPTSKRPQIHAVECVATGIDGAINLHI